MDMESKAAVGAGALGGAEMGSGDAQKNANTTRRGVDGGQNAACAAKAVSRQASDDEILGLDLGVRGRAGTLEAGAAGRGPEKSVDEILFGDEATDEAQGGQASEKRGNGDENRGSDSSDSGDQEAAAQDELAVSALTPEARAAVAAHPELGKIVEEAAAYRGIFPSVEAAREVAGIFPNADSARAARQDVAELSQIDALFSANRPEAHAELAAAAQRLNPEAFQSLARMMRAVAEAGTARSAGRASDRAGGRHYGRGAREARPENGASSDAEQSGSHQDGEQGDVVSGSRENEQAQRDADAQASERAQAARAVNQDAQRAFFHEANAAAVEGVLSAIRTQVDRLLPEEISEGARKRVVGDIYRELGGALESTAGFGDRVRQVFVAGRLDGRTRDAVVRVIVDQARQSIPGIAKKVINEWTTSVVGASKARTARQKAAAARVDIASGTPSAGTKKALMPRDVDYRRLSDADILNL
jgi:hypothetical protein